MKKQTYEFVTTPHEREKGKTINEVPKTVEEFFKVIELPFSELKHWGFRKWSSMNDCVKENIKYADKPKMVSIPTFNANEIDKIVDAIKGEPVQPSGSMIMDLAPKEEVPMQLLDVDMDICLFPGEWYNIIPDGFECISLHGEKTKFRKGKSDDDIRFGCIAYGILKSTSDTSGNKS